MDLFTETHSLRLLRLRDLLTKTLRNPLIKTPSGTDGSVHQDPPPEDPRTEGSAPRDPLHEKTRTKGSAHHTPVPIELAALGHYLAVKH